MSSLPTIEGPVRKLDTALGMRRWGQYWAKFVEDRLCFFHGREDIDPSEYVDLNMVTSLKEQGYNSANTKEDETFQIQISGPFETVYICLDSEEDLSRWLTAIRWRVDFFMSDRIVPSSPAMGSSAQDIPGSRPSSYKEDKSLFSISNSERQNQGNLKGYYAMLKNRNGSQSLSAAGGMTSPRDSSSSIISPVGSVPSSASSISSIPEIDFGRTSPSRVVGVGANSNSNPTSTTTSPIRSQSDSAVSTATSEPDLIQAQAQAQAEVQVQQQQQKVEQLEEKVRQLEAENQQIKESFATPQKLPERSQTPPTPVVSLSSSTGSLGDQQQGAESLKKQLAELNSSLESKKRSFTLIVASKDEEIAKLRREASQAISKRVSELETSLAAKEKELADLKALRDREVLELQQKLSDKELEVLELREREFALRSKQEQQNQEALMAAIKKQRETEEILGKVKDRFFFSLAMNFKLSTQGATSLDLNALYERVKREQVPFDKWQEWLTQRLKEFTGGVGEDPEDARGF